MSLTELCDAVESAFIHALALTRALVEDIDGRAPGHQLVAASSRTTAAWASFDVARAQLRRRLQTTP